MQRAFSHWFMSGLVAASLLILTGCATSETGRIQFGLLGSNLSSSQEAELGFTAFEQMKKEMPISKDPAYNALVTEVGQRIAEQAKSKLPDAKWEFVVFESKEANAFCLPGGKIGVYTGILPLTQNKEGLAAVLGHEVAHASNHHGAERMGEVSALQKAAGSLSGMASEKYQTATALFLGYGAKGVELAFSRTHESEADHVGLLYMARAGYNPEEAVKFWERFAAASKGQPEGFKLLRTHPLTADRIADIKKLLPEAKAAYKPAK